MTSSSTSPHHTAPEAKLPKAARVLPFFATAPVAVAAAGLLLLVYGEQALASSWSSLTMGLAHAATLGFLTMILMGSFYVLLPFRLGIPIKAPRLPYFVYAQFTIAVGALCVGLARVAVTPVFIAIAALFLALGSFLWPAATALRGTRGQPAAEAFRIAIASLVIAASIGIWVAHGHGGMKFPGPRGLWIEVHLSIALFGWIGGMARAEFDRLSVPIGSESDDSASQVTSWWGRLALLGILLSSLLLGLQYVGVINLPAESANWFGAVAVSPTVIAGCGLQSITGLRRLQSISSRFAEPQWWRSAFLLGPVTGLFGLAALLLPAPQWPVAFGWIALWGWAGLMVHAMLRELAPLLFMEHPGNDIPLRDGAYLLHLASLVSGLFAIASGSPILSRLTGGLLLVLAGQQALRIVRVARINRTTPFERG